MEKTYEVVLALVRKALAGSAASSAIEPGLLEGVDWSAVAALAYRQGVSGLVFSVVEGLPASVRPGMDVALRWYGQVLKGEQVYAHHREVISSLASFYAGQCIPMVLLKGYGLSLMWPEPSRRPVGDIDVYLGHLWEFADTMVSERLGVVVESGHEHHTTFTIGGVMVENHYDFINTKAHADAPMIEDRLKKYAALEKCVADSSIPNVYYPSADFNALFLIRHMAQHFAGEGVTLRQVVDWGLFLEKDWSAVNWAEILPFLRSIGLIRFFNVINAICADYLGLAIEPFLRRDREPSLEKRILYDILAPEFSTVKPKGLVRVLVFKLRRWLSNTWKISLVYNESLLSTFFRGLWQHLRRFDTIQDG